MFVPLVLVLSVIIAFSRGGRLQNLARLEPRYIPLLFIPLLLQIIAFSPVGDLPLQGGPLARWLYAASLAAAVLALALNRHLPGVSWIAAGLALNFAVIALNGGFMPVSAGARDLAGLPPLTERDKNLIPLTDATVLPFLADILPLPRGVPFATVYSPGDILLALGGVIFIQRSLVHHV